MRPSVRALGAVSLAVCGLAGLAAAFGAVAVGSPGQTTTAPPTTTTPPPTVPPVEPPVEPTPAPIAFGVSVGGVKVGGMMPFQANKAVQRVYKQPLLLVVDAKEKVTLEPARLGAHPNFPKAIRRARLARPGALVPLDVEVSQARVRTYVDRLAGRVNREPRDARIDVVGRKPKPIEAQDGRHLKRLAAGRSIRTALATNSRAPIRLGFEIRRPEVRSDDLEQAIVIMRSSNRLLYFHDLKLVRWFGVATGQAAYPTPVGDWEIVTKQRDPWWYPPPSPWAEDSDPVPPGPGNPLGTRWMGLDAPYVGIHGTPDAASIGYSASHGCIRMRIPDAEWLFNHVDIGTPVFIVNR